MQIISITPNIKTNTITQLLKSNLNKLIYFNPDTDRVFIEHFDLFKKSKNIEFITFACNSPQAYDKLFELINSSSSIKSVTINSVISDEFRCEINKKLENNYNLLKFYIRLNSSNNHTNIEFAERNYQLHKLVSELNKTEILAIGESIIQKSNHIIRFFSERNIKITNIYFGNCNSSHIAHIINLIDKFSSLEQIDFRDCKLTDDFFKNLLTRLPRNNSKRIRILFYNDKLSNNITSYLIEFCSIHQNYILQAGCFSPEKFEKLLNIIDCKATAKFNRHKISDKNDFSFILNNNEIIFNFSIELVFHLKEKQIIREIDISKNSMNETMFEYFVTNYIKNNPSLTKLRIHCNKSHNNGIKKLAKIINKETCNLTHLDFSFILPKEFNTITQQVAYVEQIKNGLSNESINLLLEELAKNKKIIYLDLSGQNIIEETLKQLASTLITNNTLTNLRLDHLLLKEDTAINFLREISEREKTNKSLVKLTVNKYIFNLKNQLVTFKCAYKHSTIDLARKLISNNLNYRDSLIDAIQAGNIKEVSSLLKNSSFYTANKAGAYLIFIAIEKGYLDIIKFLVTQCNYNLAIINDKCQTPFEYAQALKDENKANRNIDEIINFLSNHSMVQSNDTSDEQNNTKKRKLEENTATLTPHKKIKTNSNIPNPYIVNNNNFITSTNIHNSSTLSNRDIFCSSASDDIDLFSIPCYQINNFNVINPSDNSNNYLLNLIKTNNIDELNKYLSNHPDIDLSNIYDEHGKTLLHIAIHSEDHLSNSNQLKFDRKTYYLIIYTLITAGATVHIDMLNQAIQKGDYRLFKILLASNSCDPNERDKHAKTPIIYAIGEKNEEMIARLLIDRNLKSETIDGALSYTKNLLQNQQATYGYDSTLGRIVSRLEKRLRLNIPENEPGIQWGAYFNLFYGSHPSKLSKTVEINSEKQFAYLAQGNCNHKISLQQIENTKESNDSPNNLCNSVTASLVFIVSNEVHFPHQVNGRSKIRITLDFDDTLHLFNANDISTLHQIKQNIKQRIANINEDVVKAFHANYNVGVLTAEDIENTYQDYIYNNNLNFINLFCHGVQTLLDYLEHTNNIQKVVDKLSRNKKFVNGCKVYAAILEIYSPNNICENCELAILSAQDERTSLFLTNLKQALEKQGCILPTFSPFRMITLISKQKSMSNDISTQEDQGDNDYFIDIRSCKNNIILARNNKNYGMPFLTQFNSSIPKFN